MAKPRAGYEKFGAQFIALAEKEPALRPKGFNAAAARAELATAESLDAVIAEAEKQLALAKETRFYHASNSWTLTLRIYQHAQAEAPDDPDVAYAIAQFVAFMKARTPKNARKTTTTPSTPASSSPSSAAASSTPATTTPSVTTEQ